jgi:hypothetical protein
MRSHPHRLLCAVALVVIAAATSMAADSDPVAAVDNIPPAPVTQLRALNTGSDVLIMWAQSADDAFSSTTFGDAIVPRGGVNGYRVYRTVQGEPTELLGVASPGQSEFSDPTATHGVTYIYTVNAFDLDNEVEPVIEPGSTDDLARIIFLGGSPPEVVVVTRVQSQITFEAVVDVTDEAAVEVLVTDFTALMANLLGIDPSRINVIAVTAGSVIIDFEILEVEDAGDEPAAGVALANLLTIIADDTADEFATIGPVLEIQDNTTTDTVVIPRPIDAEGNVIKGWFTRGGSQVGFDDFFAFVSGFGRNDTEANFDGIFDIVPNGVVDLDDFFAFVADFGKVVSNAVEIQGLLNQ